MTEYKVIRIRIGITPDTEKLYKLEKIRDDSIRECSEEWRRLMKKIINIDCPFFEVALPTAFYDMMSAYDTDAAICASKIILEENGYKLKKVKP